MAKPQPVPLHTLPLGATFQSNGRRGRLLALGIGAAVVQYIGSRTVKTKTPEGKDDVMFEANDTRPITIALTSPVVWERDTPLAEVKSRTPLKLYLGDSRKTEIVPLPEPVAPAKKPAKKVAAKAKGKKTKRKKAKTKATRKKAA